MWKENLYQPFEILVTERTVFLSGVHQHSFFELGYVLSGTGCLTAFGEDVSYRPGTLFLIHPETTHRYNVETVSRFVCLRFTRQAIADYLGSAAEPFLTMPGDSRPVSVSGEDARRIRALFLLIWREKENPGMYSGELLLQWSVSALLIVARNLAASVLPAAGTPPSEIEPPLPSPETDGGSVFAPEAREGACRMARQLLEDHLRRALETGYEVVLVAPHRENLPALRAYCRRMGLDTAGLTCDAARLWSSLNGSWSPAATRTTRTNSNSKRRSKNRPPPKSNRNRSGSRSFRWPTSTTAITPSISTTASASSAASRH